MEGSTLIVMKSWFGVLQERICIELWWDFTAAYLVLACPMITVSSLLYQPWPDKVNTTDGSWPGNKPESPLRQQPRLAEVPAKRGGN